MPDFKTHYSIIMLTIFFVLGFFLLIQNPSKISSATTGFETVTGRIAYNPENEAEKLIFNYLNYFRINGEIKNSYYKNGMWKVEVDITNSEDDAVFDVFEDGEIKCFERFRERKCYDNFDILNKEFQATLS